MISRSQIYIAIGDNGLLKVGCTSNIKTRSCGIRDEFKKRGGKLAGLYVSDLVASGWRIEKKLIDFCAASFPTDGSGSREWFTDASLRRVIRFAHGLCGCMKRAVMTIKSSGKGCPKRLTFTLKNMRPVSPIFVNVLPADRATCAAITDSYKSGKTIKQVSEQFGMSHWKANITIKKLGLSRRKGRSAPSPEPEVAQ